MNIFGKRKTESRFKLNPTATHLKPCNKVESKKEGEGVELTGVELTGG